jgi:hypothetical protein
VILLDIQHILKNSRVTVRTWILDKIELYGTKGEESGPPQARGVVWGIFALADHFSLCVSTLEFTFIDSWSKMNDEEKSLLRDELGLPTSRRIE